MDSEIRGPKPGEPGWRPGTYRGRPPAGRAHEVEEAAIDALEGKWYATRRYRRRARVTAVETCTPTGTVRVAFDVVDEEPFEFHPGQFVGVEQGFENLGFRRSPYCILSPPSGDRAFELLVRVVEAGPLSKHLGALEEGDELSFRGPTGRSMVPNDPDDEGERELVLLATGVGIAPFHSLVHHLLAGGRTAPVRLYWGLRLMEDVCLLDELEDLAGAHPSFTFDISLSQPPPGWPGLRGRLTESVPPLLGSLAGKRFHLAGNGAMIEEMATVLSDLGVDGKFIYKEAYFNAKHRPDAGTLAAIRSRFVATDLAPPHARREAPPSALQAVLSEARTRAPGSPGALAVSEIFELLPSFLNQEDEEEDEGEPPR